MAEQDRTYSTAGIVALIVIGLVLLIPSGLCTAILGGGAIYAMITQPANARDAMDILPMVLLAGGPFVLAGGVMVVAGINQARANARNRES